MLRWRFEQNHVTEKPGTLIIGSSDKPLTTTSPVFRCGLAIVFLCVSACSHQALDTSVVEERSTPIVPANYNGFWERDYSRGGDINEGLTRLVRQLNRSARSPAGNANRSSINTSSSGMGSIIALARLADSITRSDVLEIIQDDSEVRVNRENDFALTCEFNDRSVQLVETTLGTELCGWDGQKMVFHLALPDALNVTHRLTMSPDRKQLHVATTVASGSARTPFTLNRFYTRFEPEPSKYECTQTLSQKKVCWIRQTEQ